MLVTLFYHVANFCEDVEKSGCLASLQGEKRGKERAGCNSVRL